MRTSDETIRELERLWTAANYRERGSGFGTLTVDGEFSRMTFNHKVIDIMPDLLADLRDLAAAVKERDELRAELSEWKAAFKVDDREGDSRLMAVAMGQALDAAVKLAAENEAAFGSTSWRNGSRNGRLSATRRCGSGMRPVP